MRKNKPVSRKDGLVIQEFNGELLVYDLRDDRALCLNESSQIVWQACNGDNSPEDIARIVGNEDVVWLALDQLKKERLIETNFENEGRFEGLSRREVIRKIGLGSMIALPVIASLVVPTNSQAASCLPVNATCTVSSQCCSTCCKNVSPGANQCKSGGGACLP